MGPKVLKTHQKKVRKAGEEKKPKRFVHKSFNKQVADISVSVSHFTELGHDVGKDGDLQQSHLQEAIQEWRGINRCEAFGAFCFKLRPLCRTMPMIIFNLDKIVPIVLDNLKDADSLGLEPVLGVLAALSRDARHELTPYFHDIFNVLVDLLETCLQNAPVLEKIFQCFSFLFKYLVKYITKDLEPYAEAYGRLFSHHKHYIRQFAGESFAFLLRRSDAKRAVELLLRQLDRCDPAKEDYLADSIAVVITEASKSIQNGFHSKLEDFFNVLLSTKNITKSVARRRVVKSAFLRLRNHADELEFCAPLLEIWYDHWRAAWNRRCGGSSSEEESSDEEGSGASGSEDAPVEKTSGKKNCAKDVEMKDETVKNSNPNDEVRFYLDCFVAFVCVQPRPYTEEDDAFDGHVSEMFDGIAKLLDLVKEASDDDLVTVIGRVVFFLSQGLPKTCQRSPAIGEVINALLNMNGKIAANFLYECAQQNCLINHNHTAFAAAACRLISSEKDTTVIVRTCGVLDFLPTPSSGSKDLKVVRRALLDILARTDMNHEQLRSKEATATNVEVVVAASMALRKMCAAPLSALDAKQVDVVDKVISKIDAVLSKFQGKEEVDRGLVGARATLMVLCARSKATTEAIDAAFVWSFSHFTIPFVLEILLELVSSIDPKLFKFSTSSKALFAKHFVLACRFPDQSLRHVAFQLMRTLPKSIARLYVPDPTDFTSIDIASNKKNQPSEEAATVLDGILQVCETLEGYKADFQNERPKQQCLDKIGRAIVKYQSLDGPLNVAMVMAVATITSQYTVRFNTLWKPAMEQLVLITSSSGYATGTTLAVGGSAGSDAKSGDKRKNDSAEEGKKKKKKKSGVSKAQRAREEANWSDESDHEDYLETSSRLAREKKDVWVELVWKMATDRIDDIQVSCESQITEIEEDSGHKKQKTGMVYESRKKIVDERFLDLNKHGDQLTQSLGEARAAFDALWSPLDGSYNPDQIDNIRESLWFWKTISSVMKSAVWNLEGANSDSDVDELGAARTRWIVNRFLELFEKKRTDAYTRALTGRLVQCLEVVAEVPCFDRFCPRSMVRRIMQTCSTWTLMEPEVDIQKHAIKVLMNCNDLRPSISPYRESLLGVIGEKDFRDAMLRLSFDTDTGLIKPEHREKVLPIILRLFFSKLIKKSKKLDKKGNQKHSRRAAVFSAFAALQQDEIHHLLAVMLHGVLSFRRVEESKSVASGKKVGDIPRARILTHFLKQVCMKDSTNKIERIWCEDETDLKVPVGFTYLWTVENENQPTKTLAVSLEDTARVRRLLGFLNSCTDMISNMADTIYPVCELLMSLFITILQRTPAATIAQTLEDKIVEEKDDEEDEEDEKDEEKQGGEKVKSTIQDMMGASSHRALVRETIRRMTDLTIRFPVPKTEQSWSIVLAPIKPTVDFLVSRLFETSGCVQMSAVVNMLIQWSFHPELLPLFEMFPGAVPTLLSLFSAPAVLKEARTIKQADACTQQRRRKEAKKQGKKALIKFDRTLETPSGGPVIEAIMDMIMRLSKGGQDEFKELKKREKKYKDIRRDAVRRARRRGDSSDEEDSENKKSGEKVNEKADFIEAEIQEKWLSDGLNLVQPHADLMLKHIAVLIQHRKDNCPEVPLATMKELDLLETIAIWADSQESVLTLTKLLCMSLLQRPKAKTNSRTSKQLAALISLVPRACFVKDGDMSKLDENARETVLLPRQLEKLLPHAQNLGARKQICEVLLLSEMALRGLDAKAMVEKLQSKMNHNDFWNPEKNPIVDDKTYTEVHVAHMMLALNALRGTLLVTDPDTDSHVAMLESFADECCLGKNRLPANLAGPVLSHLLFLMSCGDIDFAVRNACERALTSLADRCAQEPESMLLPKDGDAFPSDASHLFYLLMHKVITGLRRNLKSEGDDVQRSNLKVLSHFTRVLGPLVPKEENVSEDVFGNSPAGLLHTDLLPYLRKNAHAAATLDEGGDLFHELLHLQKHRRGRAAIRASKLIIKGQLSRPTIVHIIQPLCVSMILQLSSNKQNFDSNLAESALRCLGAVCQSVKWSTILNTLRYLSGTLMRRKDRENIVVKTICHVLQSYRYACPDATKSQRSAEAIMQEVDAHRSAEVDEEELFPGEKSAAELQKKRDEQAAREKAAKDKKDGKKDQTEDLKDEKEGAKKEEEEKVEEDKEESEDEEELIDADEAEKQREIVARSVKSTVLPILRKILWEKDKEAQAKNDVHHGAVGGKKRKGREPQGTIRVGVVSVLLHVLRYLPAEQFHGQLPRLVHVLTEGLLSRDAGQRRAARFAASHVVTALGSPYFPWLIREMKPRMTRGYAIPVLMMTAHTCLEALVEDKLCLQAPTLQEDLNTATCQLMPLVELEVERLCDPSRLDNDADERLPNQVNESKAVRGPTLLRVLARYTDPELVQVQVIQSLYGWLLKDRTSQHENWGQTATNATSLKFLRRVEELMKSAIDGLLANDNFSIQHQHKVTERLLSLTRQLLNPKKFGVANDEALFKKVGPAEVEGPAIGAKTWISPKKEKLMTVQAGAALGRGAWHGTKKPKGQTGFDMQIRAKVLGIAGLRVLLRAMRHEDLDSMKEKIAVDIIPLVAACFVSSQDQLFIHSSKCLHRMLVIFKERPEVFEDHAERIAVTVLNVFRRAAAQQGLSGRLQRMAAARGLGVPGGSEIVGTCTKTLATLLRKRVSSDWFNRVHDKQLSEIEDVDMSIAKTALKSTFLEALVGQIHASLDHDGLRPSSLLLLSRVLLHQKVEIPAVYECVERVGEVLIRGGDTITSKRCAQIYVEFMMDYPHEDKALQNKLTFLVRNLGFNEEGGRRSVINALYMVVNQFPVELLTKRFGALIFVPVVARLPQETDDQARKMLEVLILALFGRVDKNTRNQLLALALRWKTSDKALLKIALAELLALVPSIEGEKSLERFGEFVPVLRQLLPTDDSAMDNGEVGPVSAPAPKDAVHWRLVYSVMRAFEKFACFVTPAELDRLSSKKSPIAADVTGFWNDLVGKAIANHPHPWVRAVALRTLQSYLTNRSADEIKPGKHCLMAGQEVMPFATMRNLCSIFASGDLEKHPDLVAPLMRTTLGMVQLALGAPWLAALSNEETVATKEEEKLEMKLESMKEVDANANVDGADNVNLHEEMEIEEGVEIEYEDEDMADVGNDQASAKEIDQDEEKDQEIQEEVPEVFDPQSMQPKDASDGEQEDETVEKPEDEENVEDLVKETPQEATANLEEDLKPSLFEKFLAADAKAVQADDLRLVVDAPTKQEVACSKMSIEAAAAHLHHCRVKYAVVRLSYIARRYLASPQTHVVALASIFRLFGAMASELCPEQVEALVDPFVGPLYRALSLANKDTQVQVGDITTTQQLLSLNNTERREVLANLAQQALDVIESHCTSSSSAYGQAIARARNVTAHKRRDRAVKLRQDKIARPEVHAQRKIKKHAKGKERRKRNLDQKVLETKGGYDGSKKRIALAMRKMDKWD